MEDALRLKKGDKLRLTKMLSYKDVAYFALTWNTNRYGGRRDFDLDLSMICVNEEGLCEDDRYFIWYEHKVAPKKALKHSGDNRTGVGDSDDGDAEVVEITLNKIPEWVRSIVAVVTIYDHREDQHFGLVDNAFVRIMDNKKEEKLRFSLSEEAHVAENVGMIFGQLDRLNETEWEFNAMEEGSNNDLEDYIEEYGMNLRKVIETYAPQMLQNQ